VFETMIPLSKMDVKDYFEKLNIIGQNNSDGDQSDYINYLNMTYSEYTKTSL